MPEPRTLDPNAIAASPEEAARFLSVHRRTIDRLIADRIAASRASQSAFETRQRKRPAARADQRLQIQFPAIGALAARPRRRAILAAPDAPRQDAPAKRKRLAYGLDSHRTNRVHCPD